jgi:hypothetical protein
MLHQSPQLSGNIGFFQSAVVVSKLKQHAWLLVLVIPLALTAYYLSAWLNMPIYPDETSFRLQSFRAIADGRLRYSPFPYCGRAPETSLPLLPFAYLLAALDSFAGWSFVRAIPFISVLSAVSASMLAMRRRASPAALLLPLAFIGVAGSGLILMRGDCFLILQGTTIFLGYWLLKRPRNNTLDASWIVGSVIFSLVSIQIHPQGLVLLPVSLIMMARLVMKSQSRAVHAAGCLAMPWIVTAASFVALSSLPACSEYPSFQNVLSDLSIFGPSAWPVFSSSLSPWLEKFATHANNFTFKEGYIANYLPGFGHEHVLSLQWPNLSMDIAVWLNLAGALLVIGWASIASLRLILRRGDAIGARFATFLEAGSTFLALGGGAMFALFLVDHYTLFYRSFCAHMAFVLINATALSSLPVRRQVFLGPVYCLAVVLCLQSTITTSKYIDSKFISGWHGPSLPLNTDWEAVSDKVSHIAQSCGIDKLQERIVVDDLTFTALRQHPHLLSLSYMWVGRGVIEPRAQPMSPVRQLGTALLVRCEESLGPDIPAGLMREGNFCCANFE